MLPAYAHDFSHMSCAHVHGHTTLRTHGRNLCFITHKHAPYVLTKPFHSSQRLIEKDHYGVTISLDVQHNFELEKDILGLGDGIKVIAPSSLKSNIKDRLQGGMDLYNTEISESGLAAATKQLEHNGFGMLNYVYTKREIRQIKKQLDTYLYNLLSYLMYLYSDGRNAPRFQNL